MNRIEVVPDLMEPVPPTRELGHLPRTSMILRLAGTAVVAALIACAPGSSNSSTLLAADSASRAALPGSDGLFLMFREGARATDQLECFRSASPVGLQGGRMVAGNMSPTMVAANSIPAVYADSSWHRSRSARGHLIRIENAQMLRSILLLLLCVTICLVFSAASYGHSDPPLQKAPSTRTNRSEDSRPSDTRRVAGRERRGYPALRGRAAVALKLAREEAQLARDYAQNLMESINDMLIVTTPDGFITTVNQVACDRLGYSADELKGQRLETIMPQGMEEPAATDESDPQPHRRRVERTLVTRQGKLLPVLLSRCRIKSLEGPIPSTIHVAVDITEQLQAEQARQVRDLRLQKHKDALAYLASRKVLHSGDLDLGARTITEIVAVTLSVARVNLWLHHQERLVLECIDCYDLASGKHSRGETLDVRKFPIYLASLEAARSIAATCARSDPRTEELDRIYLAKHGISSLLDSPIRLQGQIAGVLCIEHVGPPRHWNLEEQGFAGSAADLASLALEARNRHKAQEQLEAALNMAEAATRAKSSFLANMSHEIRTPLNAIIGYSELLQEEAEELGYEELIPDLRKIHAAGKHLCAVISDILDLSKIEAGKMQLRPERFDIAGLVSEIVSTARPLIERNHNDFEVRTDPGLGMMVGDKTRIRQIVLNLLSNAGKFTESGFVRFQVVREVAHLRNWIRFTVRDSGIGIAEDALKALFEDFTQIDSSATRKYAGTGLGLAISRRVCYMMGGEISVQSKVGEGSTFTVRIPAEALPIVLEESVGSEPEGVS